MDEEICKCEAASPVVLQFNFSNNSIVCIKCNLNVYLKKLTPEIKDKIELWNEKYEKQYRESLESDNKIEAIKNPANELNTLGFSIVSDLNKTIPTYYWWHLEEEENIKFCPECNIALEVKFLSKLGQTKTCETCRILIRE